MINGIFGSNSYKKAVDKIINEKIFSNVMQIPKFEKVVLNMGVGKALNDSKIIDKSVSVMKSLSLQKPIITKSKKAVSGFKLRENKPIGVKVTLRGDKMYSFMVNLINVAIPRLQDFYGFSRKSFDGKGNYSFGLKDVYVFYELEYDKIGVNVGMDVTFVTSAKNDKDAELLFDYMEFPFRKK